MDRLSLQEARLIEALRRLPRVSPARAAPPRRAASKRKPRSPDTAQRWAEALERALPKPQRARQPALDDSDELFSRSSGSGSPLHPPLTASSSSARRVSPPRWRLVEPGEVLTQTPVPQPATPYLQTWTRQMDDGRTLRVVNRVPRPPKLLTSEPRRQNP